MVKFPTFQTEDEIPEGFRDAYEEKDGEWVVKAPEKKGDGPTEDDIEALKEVLDKERTDRRDAEKEVREIRARLTELEQEAKAKKAGLSEEELKKLRADVRKDIEEEYASKPLSELPEDWKAREEGQGVLQENRSLKLDSQVKALAGKNGVRAERIEAWWRQFSDRFDLTEDGKPMVKEHPGKEVVDFITGDLKEELPDFYAGTQAAGGGAGGIQRNGEPVPGTSADDVIKNPGESLRAAREAGATS